MMKSKRRILILRIHLLHPDFMINRPSYFLLLLCFAFAGCISSKKSTGASDELYAKDILAYGRTDMVNNELELISSAVHFGFSFEGDACEIFASLPGGLDHNYLQYELDGVYQKRIRISKDSKAPIELRASTGGTHYVWIYKATEASTGAVFIEKIKGRRVKALLNSNAPLIEFIGNSITCGAAADASELPCGQGEYRTTIITLIMRMAHV